MVLVVNASRNDLHTRLNWKWYHVPRCSILPPASEVVVQVVDSDGKEITRDIQSLGGERFLFSGCFHQAGRTGVTNTPLGIDTSPKKDPYNNRLIVGTNVGIVAPYFLGTYYGLNFFDNFSPKVILTRTITLSIDEIKRASQFTCSVRQKP